MATLPTTGAASPLDAQDGTWISFGSNGAHATRPALNNMPSDFSSMDTLTASVYWGTTAIVDDGITGYVRIVNSDATVVLAGKTSTITAVAANFEQIGTVSATNQAGATANITFTYVNTTASKADWDGAQVQFFSAYTQTKGNDSGLFRVDYLTVGGTYTVVNTMFTGDAAQVLPLVTTDGYSGRATPGSGDIERVQTVVVKTADTTDTSLVGTWTPTADNYALFMVVIAEHSGTVTITAAPTGWTELVAKSNPGGAHQSIVIYGRELDGTATDDPTLTISAGRHMLGYLIEYEKVDHTVTPTTVTNGSGVLVDKASTGTTAVTSQAPAVAVGFFGHKHNAQNLTAPRNNFTLVDEQTSDQGTAGSDSDRVQGTWFEKFLVATGTQETGGSFSVDRRYAAAMVVLYAEPGTYTGTIDQALAAVTQDATGAHDGPGPNQPPTAAATADPNPAPGSSAPIGLDGTGSSDSDGTIASYQWELVFGPTSGSFDTPTAATCTWTPAGPDRSVTEQSFLGVAQGAAGSFTAGAGESAVSTYLISTADALDRANLVIPSPASGRYYQLTASNDRTWDARGLSYQSVVTQESHTYVTRVGGTHGDVDRGVWVGGYVTCDVPLSTKWDDLKNDRDGAGMMARAGEYMVIDGMRIYNVMDGIRPQVSAIGGVAAYSIRNCWMEYVRDDTVEPDAMVAGGEFHDNLIDGVFMGYSFQLRSTVQGTEPLRFSHNLIRLAPMPYDTDVGLSNPYLESTYGGPGSPRHAQMFKQYGSDDPDIIIEDNVFFIEQHSVNGVTPMAFPTGAKVTYTGTNVLIWIGDTANPAAYPGTLPGGGAITEYNLLTHTEAELWAMWDAYVATWKTRHGYASNATIDDEPTTPSKLISPGPFA